MADENIYDEFKEAIPVMSGDTMDIAIDEAFAPIGQSNSELNHAVLNNRDIPNQHPITAIEGLRDELNNIENLKTEYSDEMGFANYYPWEDGGDSKYSRIGYFVAVADRERRIKICTESDEVFGVTVVTAGFIGNQDGIPDNDDYSKYGTKKGSNCGVECGLVAHSGVVNVHCRSDVVKGSHVICDNDGYAKVVPEEDGGYGFKVIGIDWKNGEKYAVISLDASINQLHALGKEALEIRNRMTGLEKNVTTAVNAANQALSKVNEIGEVSQGVAGKVDEIANVVDKNNQQIADTTNKVNQAVQQAQQAQQVAQEISNKVVENAKVEIQQLKDDVSKAQDVANTAKSRAEGAFLAAQNTKDEIQTNINTIIGDALKENEEYNKTVIEIQDLKASLNKAYKKIQSWNSSNNTYTSLDGKENQKSDINTVYDDGTNYYYYNDGSWKSTTKISDTGLIASIAGMQKQVDENGAQITSFAKWKGEAAESIAAIEQKANEDGSIIDLLCTYRGDNYKKVADFNSIGLNDRDKTKIYYCETEHKFYYYKNEGWKSTTEIDEVGIIDGIANIKMRANEQESVTQLINTYVGRTIVNAVMCDSEPKSMETGVKYCYQNGDSYICQYNDGTSTHTYPEDGDLDNISNVVLNAVKEIDNYITVDTWTNELEGSDNHDPIYYVEDQDKYYHWDESKFAWLPMQISFYFTYDTINKKWELQDSSSISMSFMKAISLIQSKADANGARLDILLSGDKNNANSLAAMIAEATSDTALMQMLTQWVDKSGVIEVKDEFDENTADKDKVYYAQGTDDKEITLYYYYSNDHWLSTTDPSVAGISNSLATLKVKSDKHGGEIEGLVKDTGELGTKLSRITQRADGIESLVANIDKYSVGEYSQAYGLSLEQANNILYDGMVFIPTKDTEETYKFAIEELPFDENTAEITLAYQLRVPIDSYFESKDKTKCYHVYVKNDDSESEFYFFYNGEKWDGSRSVPEGFKQFFSINHVYQWGDNAAYGCKMWIDTGETAFATTDNNTVPETTKVGQFWYYNGSVPISITNDKTGETKVYEPKALYKYVADETDSTIKYWTKVASAKDMFNTRSLSQIRQKSNEIALEVSDTKGSVATLKNTVDNLGAHTALVVDHEGKVKAYMLGDATESGSRWQIGANNINIDGTITVTNTYNTDRKGTFSIYDFAKNRDSSNNYWLRADLADGTTPFSVDETGKLTTTELLVNNCCSTISASSNGISLLVGDKNILLHSECFAGFTPTKYKVSEVTMDSSISDTYVPSGMYSAVAFIPEPTGGSTSRGIRFVETDILGQSTVDKVKPNTTYTLSFWLKTRSGAQVDELEKYSVIYAGESASVSLDLNRSVTPTPTTSWQKYVLTFTITGTISKFYIMLFFKNCLASTQDSDIQYRVDISSFKLEEGNIATDWTPGTNKGLFNMYTTKNDQGEVQSSIAIKGNTISIESDNFTLSNEGDITAISGLIGGWSITKNGLTYDDSNIKEVKVAYIFNDKNNQYISSEDFFTEIYFNNSLDNIYSWYQPISTDYIYKTIDFNDRSLYTYYYYENEKWNKLPMNPNYRINITGNNKLDKNFISIYSYDKSNTDDKKKAFELNKNGYVNAIKIYNHQLLLQPWDFDANNINLDYSNDSSFDWLKFNAYPNNFDKNNVYYLSNNHYCAYNKDQELWVDCIVHPYSYLALNSPIESDYCIKLNSYYYDSTLDRDTNWDRVVSREPFKVDYNGVLYVEKIRSSGSYHDAIKLQSIVLYDEDKDEDSTDSIRTNFCIGGKREGTDNAYRDYIKSKGGFIIQAGEGNNAIKFKASSVYFNTSLHISSTETIKTNISSTPNVLSLFTPENSSIYNYNLKSEVEESNTNSENTNDNSTEITTNSIETETITEESNLHYGFVIGEGYNTPSEVLSPDGQHIDLYSMASINWKATQELLAKITELETTIKQLTETQ